MKCMKTIGQTKKKNSRKSSYYSELYQFSSIQSILAIKHTLLIINANVLPLWQTFFFELQVNISIFQLYLSKHHLIIMWLKIMFSSRYFEHNMHRRFIWYISNELSQKNMFQIPFFFLDTHPVRQFQKQIWIIKIKQNKHSKSFHNSALMTTNIVNLHLCSCMSATQLEK